MPLPPDEVVNAVKSLVQNLADWNASPAARFQFSMAQSPADSPAIVDVHTLRIAYPHVWQSLSDKKLRGALVKFYRASNHVVMGQSPEADQYYVEGESLPEIDRAQTVHDIQEELTGWLDELRASTDPTSVAPSDRGWDRVVSSIEEFQYRLKEEYKFDVFAFGVPPVNDLEETVPVSFNFAVLATYRQSWEPGSYQVGDLVGTVPLAPGETRRFSVRTTTSTKRSAVEAKNALHHTSAESTRTSRAEGEISKRASLRTQFQNTSQSGGDVGIADGSNTTVVSGDIASESFRVKKDFREAAIKAASEFKAEHKLELSTSESIDREAVNSGEISNPNNEITVTYLLYELQRQYRVSQRIHSLQPVIMVAQEIPAPHRVDEGWLLANDWIIRRTLLDDRFRVALDYLRDAWRGDEYEIMVRRIEYQTQRSLVEKLEAAVQAKLSFQNLTRQNVERTTRAQGSGQGIVEDVFEGLFGGDDDAEKARAKAEAAERALEFITSDLAEEQAKLLSARDSMKAVADTLAEALKKQAANRTGVDELRAHVKDNILYYMQRIWDHEVPDQRYYRLYNLLVEEPTIEVDGAVAVREPERTDEDVILDLRGKPGRGTRPREKRVEMDFTAVDIQFGRQPRLLGEIADVSRPLGYHGNYMIFPLRRSNVATTLLSLPYVGDDLGLRDPDETADLELDALMAALPAVDGMTELSDAQRQRAKDRLNELLGRVRDAETTVVIPWSHLYVEALPGEHPVLERFKLQHRALDVERARAEIRAVELDGLRVAARILTGDFEDPDIEKRVDVHREPTP